MPEEKANVPLTKPEPFFRYCKMLVHTQPRSDVTKYKRLATPEQKDQGAEDEVWLFTIEYARTPFNCLVLKTSWAEALTAKLTEMGYKVVEIEAPEQL